MAIPKSANERIRRKLRKKKKPVKDKDMTGRVVVKKSADNDPGRDPGNDPNKDHREVSEEFVKFYKGGKVKNTNKFAGLINNLIDISIELQGSNESFPFKLSRLQELKESLTSEPELIIDGKDSIKDLLYKVKLEHVSEEDAVKALMAWKNGIV